MASKKKSSSKTSAATAAAKPTADPRFTLKSRLRRMRVFNLSKGTAMVRRFPVVRQLKNGTSVGEMQAKVCPDSITFLARETKTVSREVYSSPEIQKAIGTGDLVLVKNRAPAGAAS